MISANPTGLEAAALRELRAHGERRDAAAWVAEWADRHPHRPCGACRGAGVVTPGGEVIPSGRRGSVQETCCGACRGLGRVEMTAEEVREEYRRVRAMAAARLECSTRDVDRLAAIVLDGEADPGPGHWLRAVRDVLATTRKR